MTRDGLPKVALSSAIPFAAYTQWAALGLAAKYGTLGDGVNPCHASRTRKRSTPSAGRSGKFTLCRTATGSGALVGVPTFKAQADVLAYLNRWCGRLPGGPRG